MRHSFSVASRSLAVLIVGLGLTGCGGGSSPDDARIIDPDQVAIEIDDTVIDTDETGMLRTVRSAAEFEELLKGGLQNVVVGGATTLGSLPSADLNSFSNTYTAEDGVDEFDYARYDGEYLYVAPRAVSAAEPGAVRILRTNAAGTAAEVSSIPIPAPNDAYQTVLGMYVAENRLVLMTSEHFFSTYGDVWLAMMWAPTSMRIHVFDVSDRAHPVGVLSAQMDGVFVASRRVDDRVIIVSRSTPGAILDPAKRAALSSVSLDELLPHVSAKGRASALVSARRCYVTNDDAHHGYPVITSITSFSLRAPNKFASVCYNDAADGVYVSPTALYVSQPASSFSTRQATRIHRFALAGATPNYTGSVEVPGNMWMGGQRDFRISEAAGLLRVMTTEYTPDPADFIEHRLFILRQKAGAKEIEAVSQLPNDARPEKIGKPNEQLYGVRFAGDRAYAATFRALDPLYVLDLSNSADPRIAGQLELPGFSEFLHPVTRDLLLGLGLDGNHVKAELFDVSVLEQPRSRGAVVLGGSYSYSASEALDDRHAFAWLPGADTDRFTVPLRGVSPLGAASSAEHSLYQFEIGGKQTAASAQLRQAGVITPPESLDYVAVSRSFIDGDTVWYLRDGEVWSSSWLTPDQVRGPF